jgi:hypothetical protein
MADQNVEQQAQGRKDGAWERFSTMNETDLKNVFQDPISVLHQTNDALVFLSEVLSDECLSNVARNGLAHVLTLVRERHHHAIQALVDRHPELEVPA